jgi:phosphoglycolate phosphatase-like HAD superfamily hydrolase
VTGALDIARIQAVCFDLDGTLVDTDDHYVKRAARWLRPLAFILPGVNFNALARRLIMVVESPVNAGLGLMDRTKMDELIAPLLNRLHRSRGLASIDDIHLVPGALATLERLSPRFPLGIATSRDQWSTAAILEAGQLNPHIESIATAQTTRRSKPHPEMVLWSADQLGVAPQALLMVGDTTVDIRAGRAAGAQTAGVLSGFGERKELSEAGADVILERTLELADMLLDEKPPSPAAS